MVLSATEDCMYHCHFSLQNKEGNRGLQNVIEEKKQEQKMGVEQK